MKTPSAFSGGAKAERPPAPGDPFITIEDVTVRVRDRFILPGTSWVIRAGESWAILGPNGAGKSSLARVLMDDVPTSQGTVTRHHPDAARDRIGWVSRSCRSGFSARRKTASKNAAAPAGTVSPKRHARRSSRAACPASTAPAPVAAS
jgi:ABC-type molybdenum transport system ATPase subunit/photorepair protein PhrA